MKFKEMHQMLSLRMALAVLVIGVGAGFFSYALHESVYLAGEYFGTWKRFTPQTFIYSLVFVAISFVLTRFLFKDTGGSGIPQVKLALVAYKGKMPRRMPFGKFITTFFALISGLSFGKEGPMVTIGASWAHLVAHTLKMNRQITKLLVTSGATAGLAAAFNTPISAVVFTIEEVIGQLNTKYLGPIVVTSVIASVTSYKLLGNNSTFVSLHYKFHDEWQLALYLSLGLIMSLIGVFFIKSVLFMKQLKMTYFQNYDYLYLIIAVMLTAFCSQYTSAILGDGAGMINILLKGDNVPLLKIILIIFVMKLVLASTAYTTGLSGGIFMPVLFLGAVGGAAFGLFLQKMGVHKIEIGIFAMIGMTSLLVSVIRAPFTAFVMLFEMTKDYELILPLMSSSIVAFWLSSKIHPESIYESVAEYERVHLPTARDNDTLNEMVVEDCMVRDVMTLNASDMVKEVVVQVNATVFGGFPVMRHGKLIGVVNRCEVNEKFKADPECRLRDAARYSVITIFPDQSLLVAMDKMKRFEIGRLPVVSRFSDKMLLGIITPEDIVNYLGVSRQDEKIQN